GMNAALFIDITLWGSVAVLAFMVWKRGRVVALASAREGAMDFINIVPRIALGVIGSGYIAAIIPPGIITGWLGPGRGRRAGVRRLAWRPDRDHRRRPDPGWPGGGIFHRSGGAEGRRRRPAGHRLCRGLGAVCLPAADSMGNPVHAGQIRLVPGRGLAAISLP